MDSYYTIVRKRVCEICSTNNKDINFAIFPGGENGEMVKRVLYECFGISKIVFIDNELCNYNPTKFCSIESFKRDCSEINYTLLLASFKDDTVAFLKKELISCEKISIIDLFEDIRRVETIKVNKIKNIVGMHTYGSLLDYIDYFEKIGSYCSFAPGCVAVWNHQLNMVTNHAFIYEKYGKINSQKFQFEDFNKKYIIGNDVWLGQNVILTNGISIGNGVRVAAGAVITHDISDYAVVAGIPGRIIKYRFDTETINKLNKIQWWNWTDDKINECYSDFLNIDAFIRKHYIENVEKEVQR